MFLNFVTVGGRRFTFLLIFLWSLRGLAAPPTGPTLQLDHDPAHPPVNPLAEFMYFVPLISPEPVTVFTNAGNTQEARILSFTCHTNGSMFFAVREFEFSGEGSLRNVINHGPKIRERQKELEAGHVLPHQLDSIDVEGYGHGSVEITGLLTNGQCLVTEIRLRFTGYGQPSPVNVGLVDIGWRKGAPWFKNETIARVSSLLFERKSGTPKMEVTLSSVKRRDAGNSLWRNFVGDLEGAAANLFLPPLTIAPEGQSSMLNFGAALAAKTPTFTFPFAARLKTADGGK
jgi:hypothetical protein